MEGLKGKEEMKIGKYNYVAIRRHFDQGLMSYRFAIFDMAQRLRQ